MNQPIDLSSLLNLPTPVRGRGCGAVRGRRRLQILAPSHSRRGSSWLDSQWESPEEVAAPRRHKRQRPAEASVSGSPSTQTSPPPAWAPKFVHGGRVVSVGDSVESEGTARVVSQAFLLPKDMQKEMASPLDDLLNSSLTHNAKVMQKMVAMAQKLGQSELERKKLAVENAKLLNTVARLERERNQARFAENELKSKLECTEDSLHQTLTELELCKNEAKASYQQGYNEGINVATESYKGQMPGIQDQIFASGWIACLGKSGANESSPLWTEIDLPSMATVQEGGEAEEEDSLEEIQNVDVAEQHAEQHEADAAQTEEVTTHGQEEDGGGPTNMDAAADDTPAETSTVGTAADDTPVVTPVVEDLTVDV